MSVYTEQLAAIDNINFKKKLARVRAAMEQRAKERAANREGNN